MPIPTCRRLRGTLAAPYPLGAMVSGATIDVPASAVFGPRQRCHCARRAARHGSQHAMRSMTRHRPPKHVGTRAGTHACLCLVHWARWACHGCNPRSPQGKPLAPTGSPAKADHLHAVSGVSTFLSLSLILSEGGAPTLQQFPVFNEMTPVNPPTKLNFSFCRGKPRTPEDNVVRAGVLTPGNPHET